ncbi:MAG: redox-sensing transcriptional repressor Rex [Armatimonadota bacterium]|nr:MAG: redox-sensing transcriptional repressor Rex [Armatimonadota bacterium]
MRPASDKIPQPTLSRLTLYLRCLRRLAREGVNTISSAKMEAHCGIVPAQIRKDLSYFGEFGKPGAGYDVQHLLARLTEIMQLDREQRIAIIGAGNLGAALAGYAGFAQSPFRIVGIFDNNFNKIGRMLWNHEILDLQRLSEINQHMRANIGIIAVPAEAAQEVADQLLKSGVSAILNFAPTLIEVPPDVAVRNVDLTRELEVLCYHLDRLTSSPQDASPNDDQ